MVELSYLAGTVGLGAEVARQHIALQLVGRRLARAGGIVGCRLLELRHALHAPLPDAPSAGLAATAPLSHLLKRQNSCLERLNDMHMAIHLIYIMRRRPQ